MLLPSILHAPPLGTGNGVAAAAATNVVMDVVLVGLFCVSAAATTTTGSMQVTGAFRPHPGALSLETHGILHTVVGIAIVFIVVVVGVVPF